MQGLSRPTVGTPACRFHSCITESRLGAARTRWTALLSSSQMQPTIHLLMETKLGSSLVPEAAFGVSTLNGTNPFRDPPSPAQSSAHHQ